MALPTASWTITTPTSTPAGTIGAAAYQTGVDLAVDPDGDILIPLSFTRGLTAVAQGVRLRVQAIQGEWFADLDSGVPYFQEILGQKFNEPRIRSIFRQAIINAPGVTSISSMDVSFNRGTRKLDVSWTVLTGLEGSEITDKIDFEV